MLSVVPEVLVVRSSSLSEMEEMYPEEPTTTQVELPRATPKILPVVTEGGETVCQDVPSEEFIIFPDAPTNTNSFDPA